MQWLGLGSDERLAMRSRSVGVQLLRGLGFLIIACLIEGLSAAAESPSLSVTEFEGLRDTRPAYISWDTASASWLVLTAHGLFRIDTKGAAAIRLAEEETFAPARSLAVVSGSPRSLFFFDRRTETYREYDRATLSLVRQIPASQIGLVSFGGIVWLQGRWIVPGRPYQNKGNPPSIRILNEVSLTSGAAVTMEPAEREVLRGRIENATAAVSSRGRTLVVFQALRHARIIEADGRTLRLKLPIPPGKGLEDGYNGLPLNSPETYAAAFRDKRVAVGAGWLGEHPAVFTADLGVGSSAVRLYEFNEAGEVCSEVILPLTSSDPRDFFICNAVADPTGAIHVLALSARYSGGSDASNRTVQRIDVARR
jgi:hypothetical protein